MSESKKYPRRIPDSRIAHSTGRLLLFGESRVSGSLVRERAIRNNVEYLQEFHGLAERAGSYKALLSGESEVSKPPEGQGIVSDKKILSRLGLLDRSYLTFGGALAGPDYNRLKSENPLGRYKFYSSFDLTSSRKVDLSARWFTDVVERAHDQAISLTTKSFDHAYDSLNLYTWHPAEVAKIMQELYSHYEAAGLYNSTPHFFQGSLDGVDPNHIGFVQEPTTGWPLPIGHSHSTRMGVLGGEIDTYTDITPSLFAQGAEAAGVNPVHPYLIAA